MSNKSVNPLISINKNVCHGKPVFKGTRIPVNQIAELINASCYFEEITVAYPTLPKNFAEAFKK